MTLNDKIDDFIWYFNNRLQNLPSNLQVKGNNILTELSQISIELKKLDDSQTKSSSSNINKINQGE